MSVNVDSQISGPEKLITSHLDKYDVLKIHLLDSKCLLDHPLQTVADTFPRNRDVSLEENINLTRNEENNKDTQIIKPKSEHLTLPDQKSFKNIVHVDKMDIQELEEFEILEELCNSAGKVLDTKCGDKINHESDESGVKNNSDLQDFILTKIESCGGATDDSTDLEISANMCSSLDETNEDFQVAEEQKFLDVITEECSADFESFETPPTSMESNESNPSSLDKVTEFESMEKAFGTDSNMKTEAFPEIPREPVENSNLSLDSSGYDVTPTPQNFSTENDAPNLEQKNFYNSDLMELLSAELPCNSLKSTSLSTLSSILCQESLTSAPRVSLEAADVERPLIDAGATTPKLQCAPIPTCSRESVADENRVSFSQQEAKTPANSANHSNIEYLTQKFDPDSSKTGDNSSKCDSSCLVTSDKQNPGKTDDRGLCWGFKNGRLVFGESKSDLEQVVVGPDDECNDFKSTRSGSGNKKEINDRDDSEEILKNSLDSIESHQEILTSKELNKRTEEPRLRKLELKLKNAGINDQKLDKEDQLVQVNSNSKNHKCHIKNNRKSSLNCSSQSLNASNDLQNAQNKESLFSNVECVTEVGSTQIEDSQDNSYTDISNKRSDAKILKNHKYSVEDILKNTKNNLNEIDSLDADPRNLINYESFLIEKDKIKVDSNQNELKTDENCEQEEDLIPDYSFLSENSHSLSEFNAQEVSSFPAHVNSVYHEFLEDSSSECSSECSCFSEEPQEHYIVISRKKTARMRGDGSTMSDGETKAHNPDKGNLKSLLKRSGGRKKDKNKNRVVFNENKNEFFDADYIILIREECDFDEEEDDSVCTCNQHEMVRLTCCEPNCNCQYDGYDQTPPSPKFAPPIEFVDAVTLSPPEGYKDMELGEEQLFALQQMARRNQREVVCRECSASHDEQMDEEGECSLSEEGEAETCQNSSCKEEKEKTDQSQQTTPTTPPCAGSPNDSNDQRHVLNSVMTSSLSRSQREEEEDRKSPLVRQPAAGSPISGILKGGRLWKQSSSTDMGKPGEQQYHPPPSDPIISDDETSNKRSVRFVESSGHEERRDVCDGAAQPTLDEENSKLQLEKVAEVSSKLDPTSTSPETTEMMLTFKLGSHVLVSNNSLKPNSAVRQLFPNTKTLAGGESEQESTQQYLVTAESLKAFEDSKRSKLPQIVQSGEGAEDTFKRAIERNTLRRSLIRYEPRSKKQPYKTDNSLVERIKQLTCDVDDKVPNNNGSQTDSYSTDQGEDVLDSRSSPPGEEARNSPDVNSLSAKPQVPEKSFSPSSSSTLSSSSSSMSSASNYHGQRSDNVPDIQNNFRREAKPLPDIGGPHHPDSHIHLHHPSHAAHPHQPLEHVHCAISNKMSSSSNTSESRRQFLSSLAPLTACVMGTGGHGEDYYYSLTSQQAGERVSVASSAGTEYSLEDIDDGLKTQEEEEHRKIAPDVLAGTPSASESGDELAMFVQQDMNRIERIKKKYQPDKDEDDEHDDYGFNRRPSVRGIKPRFGTTTEILQQIQNQLQPPPPPQVKVPAWPYYSESNLTDYPRQKTPPGLFYANGPEEVKGRTNFAPQYRPTSLQDESLYQNCTNQQCGSKQDLAYHSRNVNIYSSTVVRVGNEYYQSLPRQRNGRPQSPPPMEMAKSYHQTMVYIPYNHIEAGYQPVRYNYHPASAEYASRVTSQNQINRRYVEPIYPKPHEYNQNMIPPLPPKLRGAQPYPGNQPPPHLMTGSRSESPVPGQFSTARSTQTGHPTAQTCGYYPGNPRYRPMINPVWPGDGTYAKMNRHSYPARLQDSSSLSTDSDSTSHSGSLPNGYNRMSTDMSNYATIIPMSSPTKSRFIERGVPEGAASISPQDLNKNSGNQTTSGTMTSPTSPQNPPTMPSTGQKPLFYAMNV